MSPSATASGRSTRASSNGTGKRTASPRSGKVTRIRPATPPQPGTRPADASEVIQSADLVTDLLKSFKFDYELVQLDLSYVDRESSRRNQARVSKPIDEDTVVRYGVAMESGSKFPPIVVYRKGEKYIVLDGNHRVGAADLAKVEVLDAYVVKNPSEGQITAYTYEANVRHGLPTSTDDRMQQAIHLVTSEQMTAVDAAKSLNLPLNALRARIDQHEADERFEKLGIRKFRDLHPTTRRRLSDIHFDPVLKAAADLVVDSRLGGEDLASVVRKVNKLRSEREQLDFIRAERASREATIKATAGGRVAPKKSLVTLARATSIINRMNLKTVTTDLLGMPADVRRAHADALSEAVTRQMDLIRELRAAPDQQA